MVFATRGDGRWLYQGPPYGTLCCYLGGPRADQYTAPRNGCTAYVVVCPD